MPPGSAIYTREMTDISDRWHVAWLIREETSRIKALGDNPEIEIRSGVYTQDDVLLIPVLIRLGPGTHENIFETWFNAYQTGDGFKYLNDLIL